MLEYLKDSNGTRAMLRAGITDKRQVASVYASQYLGRLRVLRHLETHRQRALKKAELTLDRVVEELRRVAFAQISDVVNWDESGNLTIEPNTNLTEARLSAIASIEEVTGMFGSRLRIKMHDKLPALSELLKHLSPSRAEKRSRALAETEAATIHIVGDEASLDHLGEGRY